jgi:hypothetical protein
MERLCIVSNKRRAKERLKKPLYCGLSCVSLSYWPTICDVNVVKLGDRKGGKVDY